MGGIYSKRRVIRIHVIRTDFPVKMTKSKCIFLRVTILFFSDFMACCVCESFIKIFLNYYWELSIRRFCYGFPGFFSQDRGIRLPNAMVSNVWNLIVFVVSWSFHEVFQDVHWVLTIPEASWRHSRLTSSLFSFDIVILIETLWNKCIASVVCPTCFFTPTCPSVTYMTQYMIKLSYTWYHGRNFNEPLYNEYWLGICYIGVGLYCFTSHCWPGTGRSWSTIRTIPMTVTGCSLDGEGAWLLKTDKKINE